MNYGCSKDLDSNNLHALRKSVFFFLVRVLLIVKF